MKQVAIGQIVTASGTYIAHRDPTAKDERATTLRRAVPKPYRNRREQKLFKRIRRQMRNAAPKAVQS